MYGTDEQRRKSIVTRGSNTTVRYYADNYEEENFNGSIRKIHYISGGNGLAGVYIKTATDNTLYHAYTDYQGSLIALANTNGTVAEKYAYTPWGKRRNPDSWELDDKCSTHIPVARIHHARTSGHVQPDKHERMGLRLPDWHVP